MGSVEGTTITFLGCGKWPFASTNYVLLAQIDRKQACLARPSCMVLSVLLKPKKQRKMVLREYPPSNRSMLVSAAPRVQPEYDRS